ncbi:MAG: uracil-DNA glycosylase [candidate division SR1 bacterium]|nr:MAG: uracil-DNA glycosylase [candidate division SR1 bacterium]
MQVQIGESRKGLLADEFQKPYFAKIKDFLVEEKQAGKEIFPLGKDIFNAFDSCPVEKVKVVILGQDPYHGLGQAHGLSFSVQKGVRQPPSLKNIFKELESDLGIKAPEHGCLQQWADQGVLLLNASLTVRRAEPMSHSKIGREQFTDAVIKKLSDSKEHLVFVLWGAFAQTKEELIDSEKHLILKSTHPSPFSAHRGFLGSKPFSKINAYLSSVGKEEIDWKID